MRRTIALAALALTAFLSAPPAHAAEPATWSSRVAAATRYAEGRAGLVSFAVVDETGRLHGYRAAAAAPSASVLKAMLLAAYLRKADVRARPLRRWERDLLGPMIRRSDNDAASAVLGLVGSDGVYRLARDADMRSFRLRLPIWGLSEITARDQARFFYRIDSYVPVRHRAYALRLLASIVDSQRWGIARVAPGGWSLHFKGGWGSGTGLVDHQIALLRAGGERVSVAVLTRFNPDHAYGKETLRGTAARLLRRLPRPRLTIPPAARFAFSSGYAASLDGGCRTLRLRALAGGSAAVSTGADGCVSVRLALAGPRALWSRAEGTQTRVLTAALDDPVATEVATLEEGEVLRSLAGGGATLAFSYDSYDADGGFAGGSVTFLGRATCPVPERARIAVAGPRFAAGAGDALEVRDAETCALVATLNPAGTVEAVALAGELLAALVRDENGVKRIERYAVSSATRLGATRVRPATAPALRMGAGRVVYRVGRTIAVLTGSPMRKRALWRPRDPEIGLAASGSRIAWAADAGRRGHVWTLALPR